MTCPSTAGWHPHATVAALAWVEVGVCRDTFDSRAKRRRAGRGAKALVLTAMALLPNLAFGGGRL
jgi:hypothetical protein